MIHLTCKDNQSILLLCLIIKMLVELKFIVEFKSFFILKSCSKYLNSLLKCEHINKQIKNTGFLRSLYILGFFMFLFYLISIDPDLHWLHRGSQIPLWIDIWIPPGCSALLWHVHLPSAQQHPRNILHIISVQCLKKCAFCCQQSTVNSVLWGK